MEIAEILRREAFAFQRRHGQRVAERQCHGGGGRGGEAHRTDLLLRRQQQRHVRRLTKRALRPTGNGDERDGETAGVGNEIGQFRCFAGIGDGDHHVVRHDHAEIAVAGLARMHEVRWRAGGGEGGGDLAADMAALAHAADDHAPLAGDQQMHRLDESAVKRLG